MRSPSQTPSRRLRSPDPALPTPPCLHVHPSRGRSRGPCLRTQSISLAEVDPSWIRVYAVVDTSRATVSTMVDAFGPHPHESGRGRPFLRAGTRVAIMHGPVAGCLHVAPAFVSNSTSGFSLRRVDASLGERVDPALFMAAGNGKNEASPSGSTSLAGSTLRPGGTAGPSPTARLCVLIRWTLPAHHWGVTGRCHPKG